MQQQQQEHPHRHCPPHRIDAEEREDSLLFNDEQEPRRSAGSVPVWDPVAQVYAGGVVPDHHDSDVDALLRKNNGRLLLFGYGSLCWNPGTGPLADSSVSHKLGRAIGYRRCWCQKSADHRGYPHFPGIVCTLLKDGEYREIVRRRTTNNMKREEHEPGQDDGDCETSLTEGLLYEVPPELVDECLAGTYCRIFQPSREGTAFPIFVNVYLLSSQRLLTFLHFMNSLSLLCSAAN